MKLLVEKGFSRKEIIKRMKLIQPELNIYSNIDGAKFEYTYIDFNSKTSNKQLQKIIKENDIDAFWPQDLAAKGIKNLTCTVHSPADPMTINVINNKTCFMSFLGKDEYVPYQVEALGHNDIRDKIKQAREIYPHVCVKPVSGVNGHGYWRLTEDSPERLLMTPEEHEMPTELWLAANKLYERKKRPTPIAIMEWLPGPEVSVDILAWHGKPLTHAARIKADVQTQIITSEHEVTAHARSLVERFKVHGIVSIQYRKSAMDRWKILEMNPRPAGGSIYSEDAGFKIIEYFTRLITCEIKPSEVSQIEKTKVVKFEKIAKIED